MNRFLATLSTVATLALGTAHAVEQRPILTGSRQQGFVEIREGVTAGERVVADGLNKIQPGQPVRVARPSGGRPGAPGDRPAGGPGEGRPATARPAG